MFVLKLSFDQNLRVIYLKFYGNFKRHINFKELVYFLFSVIRIGLIELESY